MKIDPERENKLPEDLIPLYPTGVTDPRYSNSHCVIFPLLMVLVVLSISLFLDLMLGHYGLLVQNQGEFINRLQTCLKKPCIVVCLLIIT